MANKGIVFNIQRFSASDGPGIRTTVFMKGCNLRCWWCHNPESWAAMPGIQFFAPLCIKCGACGEACPEATGGNPALGDERCRHCGNCADACYSGALKWCGQAYTAGELFTALMQDHALFKRGGGVTFSGGEPLLQAEFVCRVAEKLCAVGVHTAVETAADVPWADIERCLPLIRLFLCDLKAVDPALHQTGTGRGNSRILDNLRRLNTAGAEMLIRVPVVPQFNDNDEAIGEIGRFVSELASPPAIELLPYHDLHRGKYMTLSMRPPDRRPTPPDAGRMDQLARLLRGMGLEVRIQGRPAGRES